MAQNNPRLIGLVAIVLLASIGTGTFVILTKKSENSSTMSTAQASSMMAKSMNVSNMSGPSKYKDGSYAASGGYNSPDGAESITVSLTLQHDVVTTANVDISKTVGVARQYQQQFVGGYKQLVVGKMIANLSLSRVAGSSLTSTGFNNAVRQIESQAKA